MIYLKYDEHLFNIAKDLYEDDKFSDITFITDNGSFYGHSSLIFQHIPSLSDLVCVAVKQDMRK